MTKTDHNKVRPIAGDGSSTGVERYRLIKAAFAHVQQSIRNGHHLEAITVLESILTDRLGSMVHGALGGKVTLKDTLGTLVRLAKESPKGVKAHRAPFPDDVIGFLTGELFYWWQRRNTAVHGMAKLQNVGDATFQERYAKLSATALEGVRVLLKLDFYDQRERRKNRAGPSATHPDALRLDSDIKKLIPS